MPLKIKKQIHEADGTITELEGTEAEIETFEKKRAKRIQTEQNKKKKELLLGKMQQEEVTRLIQEELKKLPSRPIIQWHLWQELLLSVSDNQWFFQRPSPVAPVDFISSNHQFQYDPTTEFTSCTQIDNHISTTNVHVIYDT